MEEEKNSNMAFDDIDELLELMNGTIKQNDFTLKKTATNAEDLVLKHDKTKAWISEVQKKIGCKMKNICTTGTAISSSIEDMEYYLTPFELSNARLDDVSKPLLMDTLEKEDSNRQVFSHYGFIGIVNSCSKTVLTKISNKAFCVLELLSDVKSKSKHPLPLSIFLWRECYSKFCSFVKNGDVLLIKGSPLLSIETSKGRKKINVHVSSEHQLVRIGTTKYNRYKGSGKRSKKKDDKKPKAAKNKKSKSHNLKVGIPQTKNGRMSKNRNALKAIPTERQLVYEGFDIDSCETNLFSFNDELVVGSWLCPPKTQNEEGSTVGEQDHRTTVAMTSDINSRHFFQSFDLEKDSDNKMYDFETI